MGTGHIKIYRAIDEWEWIDDKTMFYFWIRILLMANWEDKMWQGELVERGSFVTSIYNLASKFRMSIQQVRTCMERLKSSNQIVINSTNKRTKVTICKYEDYQGCATNEKQTNNNRKNKQITTTKKEYNTSDTNVSSYPIQESLFEEEDTIVSPKKSEIDYNYVKKLWNDSMKRKVPKVTSISKSREEKIRQRIAEMGGWEEAKVVLQECIKKINESEYCNGENDQNWVATFDWFFTNDKNWLKVAEGNYDNRQRKSQLDILTENVAKADAYYEQRYRGYGGASPYGNQTGGGPYGPDEQ